MTPEARMLIGLLLGAALAYAATPVAIRVAGHLEFFDKPAAAAYKGHAAPTPYLGGAAVMAAFVVTLLVLAGDYGRTLPLVAGVAVLWVVGTVDDRRHVSPGLRVLFELSLAAGLWVLNLGWDLGLGGAVDLAVTAVWIVAVVNAFNLFDNMDGASSTMALVVASGVSILGVVEGDPWLAAAGAALAGSCVGFLPHNLAHHGARIFLGDGGSMPLGFAIAALAMVGTSDALPAWQGLVAALLLVGLPLVDTTLVVVSRTRRGISILTGGRDHLTHRTRRRLRNARAVAAALGGAQAVVSVLALVAINDGSVAVVVIVLAFLVAAGTAIAVFEAQDATVAAAERAEAATERGTDRESAPGRRPWLSAIVVTALGVGASLSPFVAGYYDSAVWVPVGLGLVTLVAAGLIARPPRLGVGAATALIALAFGFWQLLSSTWAESVQQAILEGNRTLVLAAVVGLGLVTLRSERYSALLVGVLAAGTAVVAGAVTLRMLSGDLGNLFLSGRLDQPLGYINAQATVFAVGLWLSFAAVERRRPLIAGLGAALATLFACLILLSQSRGAALAVLASVVVALLVVPGRVRRAYALLLVGAGVAIAAGPLLGVYDAFAGGMPLGPAAQDGIRAALLSSVFVGAAWGGLTAAHGAVLRSGRGLQVRRASIAALGVAGTLALLAGAVDAGRIAERVDQQYQAFVRLSEPTGSIVPSGTTSRLVTGAGNRYDYWRVAWGAFKDAPLVGVGAGGYDRPYFAERTTMEDIRQPHSIELQALSETGLVGAGLLLAFLVGIALGARRAARTARSDDLARATTVAAVGGLTAWLVHTSVDWMHLLPGVTAVALLLGAVLLRDRDEPQSGRTSPARSLSRGRQVAVAGVLGMALVLAGASLSRQGLSELFQDRARSALAKDPARAIIEANRSLRLDREAVATYYVKAAAQARFGRGADAERTLLQAAAKEPSDFVTWALLGDLAVRRGRLARATAYYERGVKLNPRDPSLIELVRDPQLALR